MGRDELTKRIGIRVGVRVYFERQHVELELPSVCIGEPVQVGFFKTVVKSTNAKIIQENYKN